MRCALRIRAPCSGISHRTASISFIRSCWRRCCWAPWPPRISTSPASTAIPDRLRRRPTAGSSQPHGRPSTGTRRSSASLPSSCASVRSTATKALRTRRPACWPTARWRHRSCRPRTRRLRTRRYGNRWARKPATCCARPNGRGWSRASCPCRNNCRSFGPCTTPPWSATRRRGAGGGGPVGPAFPLPQSLPQFRALYDATMERHQAPPFFRYDDAYWQQLLALGAQGLRLFGTFGRCTGGRMTAAAMAIVHGASGLYHLGASGDEGAGPGAGNLSLFAMSCALMDSGVGFLNLTGGRTAAPDDPLLLFKRSNANGTAVFHIGQRIVDPPAYNAVARQWQQLRGAPPEAGKVVFWRF